ncbi:MAG: cell division protein FtsW [Verrucomicrobia bacterium]|nr:cell division protein FtsW [Verrucomicrobiota bacterium]
MRLRKHNEQGAWRRDAGWPLALVAIGSLALTAFGLVMLYNVTGAQEGAGSFLRQLAAAGIGLCGTVFLAAIPYRWLQRLAPLAYAAAIGLLVLVALHGVAIRGARRWLDLGIRFQPSDLAKLGVVCGLAAYYARPSADVRRLGPGLVIPCVLLGLPMALIFAEPDWGTSLLLGFVGGALIFTAGARMGVLLPAALMVILVVAFAVAHDPMRSRRVLAYRNLEETKEDVGYQNWQARVALGSGGLTGVGFGSGVVWRRVPDYHTDFILAAIGEELGFWGVAGLLLLYAVWMLGAFWIAAIAPDRFGALVAAGVSWMIAFSALANIAVVTGAIPNKGLPLPFISKGGSNMMACWLAAGLLLRIGLAVQRGEARNPMEERELSPRVFAPEMGEA